MLGTVMVMPILMQNGMGLGTLTIGLALLPGRVDPGHRFPIVGRITTRSDPSHPFPAPCRWAVDSGLLEHSYPHPIAIIVVFHTASLRRDGHANDAANDRRAGGPAAGAYGTAAPS